MFGFVLNSLGLNVRIGVGGLESECVGELHKFLVLTRVCCYFVWCRLLAHGWK